MTLCPGEILFAAEWDFSSSLEVGTEYNDNILLSTAQEKLSDLIFTITPAFQLTGISDKIRYSLNSVLPGKKYVDQEELDTLRSTNTATLGWDWTPKAATELTAIFQKDETLETELEAAGVSTNRNDRHRYKLAVSHNYQWTSLFSLGTTADATRLQYHNDQYPESRQLHAGLSPTLVISSRTKTGLHLNYSLADYENIADIHTVYPMLYLQMDWTEISDINVQAGYRYTNTKYRQVDFEKNEDGFIGNLSLNLKWTEGLSTTFTTGREQYNTVEAQSTERNYARLGLKLQLLEKLFFNFHLGYDLNTQNNPDKEETHYLNVAPALAWQPVDNMTLKLAASYHNLKRKIHNTAPEPARERCLGRVTFSYRWL